MSTSRTGSGTLISVCICTFRRAHLGMTLESIAAQRLPADHRLEIVVVDNDRAGSAAGRIESFRRTSPVSIHTAVEPEQNISLARNRAVSMANGDWIAFIDDDEVAAPDWLARLLGCAGEYRSAIVCGQVRPVYPDGTPRWIRRAALFDRALPPHGTTMDWAHTCNAIVSREVFDRFEVWFRPEYGLTGGEDFEFFSRASARGSRIVSCMDAVVTEEVDPTRMNLRYLTRRSIREGECYARARLEGGSMAGRLGFAMAALLKSIAYATASIPAVINGTHARPAMMALIQIGKLRHLFGIAPVQIYKNASGVAAGS